MNSDKESHQYISEQEDFLNLNHDVSQTILDLSSFNNTSLNQFEQSQVNESLNTEKRVCVYCKKQFSHQGSYGRHLDLKKGDSLHPLDEINAFRSKVIRRGNSSFKKQSKSKKPNIILNDEIGKEEKNKIRRKLRDRRIKAKLFSIDWIINRFGHTKLSESDNFAKMVCLYLPRSNIPKRHPNFDTYELLMGYLTSIKDQLDGNGLIEKTHQTYQDWTKLSEPEKENLWLYEYNKTLNETLKDFSLWQLQNISKLIHNKENDYFQEICKNDDLLKYIDTLGNADSINNEEKSDY